MNEQAQLPLKFSRRVDPSAAAIIRKVMQACLPPGMPLAFTKITAARMRGQGKKQEIVADVVLFDGLPGTVKVWQWCEHGWGHEWLKLDGGSMSCESGKWERVPRIAP